MLLLSVSFFAILLSALAWTTKTSIRWRSVRKAIDQPSFQIYAVRDDSRMAAKSTTMKKMGSNEREQLKNTMNEEVSRVQQLNTLLTAFQFSVKDKNDLIALETTVLSEMNEVRFKVQDESISLNLDMEIEKKKTQIEKEILRSEEISLVVAKLQKELDASAEKVTELAHAIEEGKESDQRLLKMMIPWMKVRDERVLDLISRFDDIVQSSDSLADRNTVRSTSISTITFPSSAALEPSIRLHDKSNAEIAAVAGDALGTTGSSLVSVTSCVITATTSFIKSPSGKLSGTAVLSAAAAVGEGAKALSQAWSAASQAYSTIDPDKVSSTSALSVDRIATGIKNAIYSKQVKEALNGVGTNLSLSASEAVKAIDIAADQVGSNLNSSAKFKKAKKNLQDSVFLLIKIFETTSSRLATGIIKALPFNNSEQQQS